MEEKENESQERRVFLPCTQAGVISCVISDAETVLWDLSSLLSLFPLMLSSTHQTQLIQRCVQVHLPTFVLGLIHISLMAAVGPFLFHLGAAAISFPPALLRGSVEGKTQGGHEITHLGK